MCDKKGEVLQKCEEYIHLFNPVTHSIDSHIETQLAKKSKVYSILLRYMSSLLPTHNRCISCPTNIAFPSCQPLRKPSFSKSSMAGFEKEPAWKLLLRTFSQTVRPWYPEQTRGSTL